MGTGQVIPSYDIVPSYKTHSLRELKRGTGQVILLITWSPLTSKVNRIGVHDRSSFLSHGPLIEDSLLKRIEEGYRTSHPSYHMVPSHFKSESNRGKRQVVPLI
jgi:hypothetical protein